MHNHTKRHQAQYYFLNVKKDCLKVKFINLFFSCTERFEKNDKLSVYVGDQIVCIVIAVFKAAEWGFLPTWAETICESETGLQVYQLGSVTEFQSII